MRVPCAFVSCSCCKDTKKMAENQRINLFSRIVKQFPHPVSSPSIALRMGLSAGCGRLNLLGHFRTARPASGHFFSHCRVVSSPFSRLCLRLSAGAIAAWRTFAAQAGHWARPLSLRMNDWAGLTLSIRSRHSRLL